MAQFEEKCTITIFLSDRMDNYREEDWVKNIWPYMQSWFTRRHGVEQGLIALNNGAVRVEWKYESNAEPYVETE